MPTTEICNLNLVAGSDIGDPNNPASGVLKEVGDIMVSQDGMQQLQFGMQVEHPEVLTLFLNWDSKKDHEKFMAADDYAPFRKKFATIHEGLPEVFHVDLQPEGGMTAALSAPVTEVATFYFDGAPPDNAVESAHRAIEGLIKDGNAPVKGYAYGVTHETLERDGVKGKAGLVVIGWDSVDDHMQARTTQAFKDNIGGLRNGAKAIEMHHVQVLNFVA